MCCQPDHELQFDFQMASPTKMTTSSELPRFVRWLGVIAMTIATLGSCAQRPEADWVQLFNGSDLSGWTPKIAGHELGDNVANTFRVEDGLLRVVYDGYDQFDGQFGHLFYEREFSHYRLRVEYRFIGDQVPGGPDWAYRNSGIMVHGQAPESMTRTQEFPASIEVQLLGGNGTDPRTNANLCSPGTHVVMNDELITQHCVESASETYHGDGWVTAEVEVRGHDLIEHRVNGETVLSYTQPQLDPDDPDAIRLLDAGAERMLSRGSISLQSESHPIEFRKVEILELND
jgi:hypothetical protein